MDELLLLHLENATYSLPLEEVSHIMELEPDSLVPIPLAPNPVLGLVYGQGRVLTVVDLPWLLNNPPVDLTVSHPLLTMGGKYRDLAFLVDNMGQIQTWLGPAAMPAEEEDTVADTTIDLSALTGFINLTLDKLTSELQERALSSREDGSWI